MELRRCRLQGHLTDSLLEREDPKGPGLPALHCWQIPEEKFPEGELPHCGKTRQLPHDEG